MAILTPCLPRCEATWDSPPPKAETEQELTQRAAGAVAGGLYVKRIGFSYLISINFSSSSQDARGEDRQCCR